MRMTRTSRAMASSILRKLSACCSALVANSSLSNLDSPSTISETSVPNFSASSCLLTPWSSMTSCSSAAMSESASSFQPAQRSEEHTYELQSLMRTSYAVFCLKKKIELMHYTTTLHHRSSYL